jgi:hypothetical protein
MNHIKDWRVRGVNAEQVPVGWAVVALVFSMGVALGPEIKDLPTWSLALGPEFIGHNLNIICGVGLAWVSQFLNNENR